ncbi:DNA-3-methyladenine glycosidase II [Citrobacter braakii]|nr:DNA-3-methyladenine glycosidase II [Citrobacter braakii]
MFTLSWQPPYDWPWMLGFLAARAVDGVETVEELSYTRSLSVGEHRVWCASYRICTPMCYT